MKISSRVARPKGHGYVLTAVLGLVVAGCGGHATATESPTNTPTVAAQTTTTSTLTPVTSPTPAPSTTPTVTATSSVVTITVPTIRTISPAKPIVVSAILSPQKVAPGGAVHATVFTTGHVARAVVYLGTVGPNAPAPVSYELTKTGLGKWEGEGSVPLVGATYAYTIGLFDQFGHRHITSAPSWTVVVGSTAPSGAPQPMPADIPLAPPFNYGNPTGAQFTAEGKSISGSEVVSNQRSDVAPNAVARFYEAKLPRAGWVVDQSTVPPAGTAAWALVATKGKRIVEIAFDSGVVHVFYGSTS